MVTMILQHGVLHLKSLYTGNRMIEKRGDYWVVIHGHAEKKGSKTDKPKGSAIHSYSIKKYGNRGAYEKAKAMHYAIVMSQQRESKK
jgi:hypothetical protein